MDVHPLGWGWGSVELEDLEDLVDLAVSAEERLLLHQFGEDAADCPDVHTQTILLLAQENLRRTVPKRLNLMSQGLDGETEGSGQAKVSNLEGSSLINEQILRLEIAMDDAPRVAVIESIAKLIEE